MHDHHNDLPIIAGDSLLPDARTPLQDRNPLPKDRVTSLRDRNPLTKDRDTPLAERNAASMGRVTPLTDRDPLTKDRVTPLPDRNPLTTDGNSELTDRDPLTADCNPLLTDRYSWWQNAQPARRNASIIKALRLQGLDRRSDGHCGVRARDTALSHGSESLPLPRITAYPVARHHFLPTTRSLRVERFSL